LFVGGTGLYLRAVLRGIFQGPPADWNIRRRWEAYALGEGAIALHARLAEVDPALATRLHPHDVRRIIRGLEVFESTGIPLSRHQNQPARPIAQRPRQIPWLAPPRGWLYRRIDKRVTAMFEQGLVTEVERVVAAGLPLSRTARQALGYREVLDHLEQGIPLSETIALIQTRTRQFAKRQYTWFRNLEECTPVEISGDESPAALASRLLQYD
jgi:tRNA dimethylallyltransferase